MEVQKSQCSEFRKALDIWRIETKLEADMWVKGPFGVLCG